MCGGNLRFKIDWASLILETKVSVFFVLLCIWGKFPSRSPPGGAYVWRGDLTKRFLRYELGGLIHEGAYFRNFTVFLHTYFVKCRRTLLNLNSKEPYPSSEREIKFCRCLLTFSIKREIWHFHVVVLQNRQRNVQKSVLHVLSYCFAY